MERKWDVCAGNQSNFEARCWEQGGERVTDGGREVDWKMTGGRQGIIIRIIIFSPLSVTVCPLLYGAKALTWQVLILTTNIINTGLLWNLANSNLCVFLHENEDTPFLHQTHRWLKSKGWNDRGLALCEGALSRPHHMYCIYHTAKRVTGVGAEACREGLLWPVNFQGYVPWLLLLPLFSSQPYHCQGL